MKTTIDIPNELFRDAEARAQLDCITLEDLIVDALRTKLGPRPAEKRCRVQFPIIQGSSSGGIITDEMVNEVTEQMYKEEAEYYAQFIRR